MTFTNSGAIEPGTITLVSVNVGLPTEIGRDRFGRAIVSGIGKMPVTVDRLSLTRLNLEGDRQADLAVHGGPDKALYAYPAEHLPRWNEELGTTFGPGTFGENLTVSGMLEDEVRIGDRWAWGDALLEVSQPRSPCYKLAAVTGRRDLPKKLTKNGRTGWYLRVLTPATVPTIGPIHLIDRGEPGMTIDRAHRALLLGETTPAELSLLSRLPTLAEGWREWATQELDRARRGTR